MFMLTKVTVTVDIWQKLLKINNELSDNYTGYKQSHILIRRENKKVNSKLFPKLPVVKISQNIVSTGL